MQIGGKGSQRRVSRKSVHQAPKEVVDKKLNAAIKKFGVQPLGEIEEVNMFKDDNSIVHFKRPEVKYSARENLLLVIGTPETK